MTEFRDLEAVRQAAREAVESLPKQDGEWLTEQLGIPFCTCGHMLWEHEIDKVKGAHPRCGCKGFVLRDVKVRQWRYVNVTSSPARP